MIDSQNPNWPLIATLKPQLRKHINIHPQEYRGERWYVLRDESNGRHLRFNASAYEFIGRMDGGITVEYALHQVISAQGDDALTVDEVIVILTQLFAIDVLRSGLPSDAKDFFERHQRERQMLRQNAMMNPLAIRIPLLDPNVFLNRGMHWIRPLFSKAGAFIWLMVTGFAAILALHNFPSLVAAVDQDILAPSNLVSMVIMFVVIKTVHEFSHAFAVKIWGGEIHEMGITILILAPVPYVDASAAWEFRDKKKRMLVGAMGVLTELFIAALALFLWLLVEPGWLQEAALNALLIASVSTVLFNANPLLRFDGYYVLQDFIEIPNLAARANRYYVYLIQRYLFGLESANSPVHADGERMWFSLYGLGAFFYRLFILVVIILFLAEEYLYIGVALGFWSFMMQVIIPLIRGVRFLSASPKLQGHRSRAGSVSALLLASFSAMVLFFPVTLQTQAEGIVWVRDQAQVYAGSEGFVSDILVTSGTSVEVGTPLVQMSSLPLKVNIIKLEAQQRALEIRSASEYRKDRIQADIIRQELIALNAELQLLRAQRSALLVRSNVAGRFVLPEAWKLKGRYFSQGEMMGYIINSDDLIITAVLPQGDIGLIRKQVETTEIRLAERLDETVTVELDRITPGGSTALISRALGAAGGGRIAVTGSDEAGLTAVEKVFQVDLRLPNHLSVSGVGERAYVRFNHGSEPLASQWLRSGRQLILSRLSF